ncbi:MAG: anthranilate synthase component I [Hyphomicrobiaceae bacterium]|nr:anthranilate synthase component I [Hyphomicrobiaceae bacterium]
MQTEPSLNDFKKKYDSETAQIVTLKLVADLETPVSAMLRLSENEPFAFLLESVKGGTQRGRYSIIGLAPDLIWRSNGQQVELCTDPAAKKRKFSKLKDDPFTSLRKLLDESRIDLPQDIPRMAAGVFGYMGYDTVRLIETLPDNNPDPLELPESLMIRPTIILIFDATKDEITAVTPVRSQKDISAKSAYNQAIDRLDLVMQRLETPIIHSEIDDEALGTTKPVSNTSPAQYKKMVKKAQDYIAAGDVFQVVLSQRFEAPFTLPPFSLYRALRRTNPSPFLYFLKFDDFCVIGSSPEILVRLRDNQITIRPIAGTRKRGATDKKDKEMAKELLGDPKELAEHLMLLDLGRNDVGRVSLPGSVKITDSFFLEYYSHVMHIVSNVIGKVDPQKYDVLDALMAGFPAGTVSGAPKVRAMEIIDELEKDRRGIYAGCVGYFTADGEMDTCIILRTSIVKDGKMYVQAGAGIVADSLPELEQKECINKAQALFHAASEAVRFASQAKIGQ